MEEQQDGNMLNNLADREDKSNKSERMRLTPRKLNMMEFDIDPRDVFKQLFGKEAYVDERTGELLPVKRDAFSQDKQG